MENDMIPDAENTELKKESLSKTLKPVDPSVRIIDDVLADDRRETETAVRG